MVGDTADECHRVVVLAMVVAGAVALQYIIIMRMEYARGLVTNYYRMRS